ncbi:MAG TPA: hypothetical protein ENF81_04110 [Thermotogaceae bacterium]|nr:hypothetical protein [Thermotogota bacterium]HEW91706.1 hypothetical protein [Thermotogaceae bacterium]
MNFKKPEILKFVFYIGAVLLDQTIENRKETLKTEIIKFLEKLDIDFPFPMALMGMIIDFLIDKIVDYVDELIE